MIEAVAERLEGAPRQFRRRWSDKFKERAVAEAMEPGASVSAIAHRIGIHPSQLFGWRRDARAGQGRSSLPAAVEAESGPVRARAVIEVVIDAAEAIDGGFRCCGRLFVVGHIKGDRKQVGCSLNC